MTENTQPRRIAVTGGTGFVGGALIDRLLAKEIRVNCFTRNPAAADPRAGVSYFGWEDTDAALEGVHAVVHLAGAPAVGQRLTAARKRVVMESRVETTKRLVEGMSRMTSPPATFICASAIGYYGSHPWGEVQTEDSPPGDDFLAQVCVNWEDAAQGAEALGVRVVRTRLGIVLGPDGGPLAAMALPFKCFVGGPIAGGKQPVSWIDLRDVVGALVFCLDNEAVSGPVNLVAPQPATNAELSQTLARVLRRPNLIPVPKFGLKLLFSDGADVIATGQQVKPARLLNAGFSFAHTDLSTLLAEHLL